MGAQDQLHAFVDGLDAGMADLLLQAIATRDPLLFTLAIAPEDDEEETDEERATMDEARADITAGRLVTRSENLHQVYEPV